MNPLQDRYQTNRFKHTRMQRLMFWVGVLALWLSRIFATAHDMEPMPNPFHADQLDDDTYEATVFPASLELSKQRPYFVMFYSPTCGHCRQILPIFNNASLTLEATVPSWRDKTTRLAVVDAIANRRLASKYMIRSFPTFFFTINGRAHRFHGPQVLSSFTDAAIRVYNGFGSGSLAADVTEVAQFAAEANKKRPRDPWFVVCRPSRSGDVVRTFVDSVFSHGNSFFAQIIESEAPALSERPAVFSNRDERSYWALRDACADAHARKKSSEGPGGEALLLWSDKTEKPLIYGGGSWDGAGSNTGIQPFIYSGDSASQFWTSRQLAMFVWEHSFNGVEVLTPDVLGTVAKRSRLGVIVTDGPIDVATDTLYYPSIVRLAQRRHKAFMDRTPNADGGVVYQHLDGSTEENFERAGQAARMWLRTPTQFLFADGRKYAQWLEALGLAGERTPHFFALDVNKGTIWRLDEWAPTEKQGLLSRENVKGEGSRRAGFDVDGEEVELIDKFLDEVEGVGPASGSGGGLAGMAKAKSMKWYGRPVRFVVNWVPFASWLMSAVGEDDLIFVNVIAVVCGWALVFKVALRPQPDCDGAVTPLLDRKHV